MLSRAAEEKRRRDSELRPTRDRLQCLRCGSEFTRQIDGGEDDAGVRARRRGAVMLPTSEGEPDEPEVAESEQRGEASKKEHFSPSCF